MVVKIKSSVYDADIEMTWNSGEDRLESTSSDLPDDFGGLCYAAFYSFDNHVGFDSDANVETEYTIRVLSIDHNGAQIFP